MQSPFLIPSVWLLLGENSSCRSQVLAVAKKLGWRAESKEIRCNKWAAFAQRIPSGHLWHLRSFARAAIHKPWPDLVIAAGAETAPVALKIKTRSPRTKLAQLSWPPHSADWFDLIVTEQGDGHMESNTLPLLGSSHSITPTMLEAEAARWHAKIARLPHPWITLLIGGPTSDMRYTDADFKSLSAYASAEAERLGGSLLIVSSPTTGEHAENLVKSILTVPHFFHRYKEGADTPYIGFLGLADVVIATGESIAMCSQASVSGRPFYIFVPPHLNRGKGSFREAFYTNGVAKPHTYAMRTDWKPTRLADAAEEVAQAIQTRLFHRHMPQKAVA